MSVHLDKKNILLPAIRWDADLRSIKFFLLQNNERIETITFARNDTQPNSMWDGETCNRFSNAVRGNKYLKSLTLDSVLGWINPFLIFSSIKTISNLTCFNLSNNSLTDNHMTYLLTLIDINKLEELNLSKNLFSQHELTEFIESFDKNNKMRMLDLSSLKISDDTFRRLATRLLYKRLHMTTLTLDNNFITSVGLDDVAGILSYNRSLTCLHLRNNWLLTDRSVLIALQILKDNTHICTFDFLESVHRNTNDTRHFTTVLR
jgi:Ran GTPase-activating protein (RanGAP) involved in mRNA processing and transport